MTLPPIVEFAPFRLDVIDERLWRGQEARPLTPKAFRAALPSGPLSTTGHQSHAHGHGVA